MLNQVRLALAVFCAIPIQAVQPPTHPPTQVTVVVMPDGRFSRIAVGAMGREAAHILKKSGVSLDWRIGDPGQSVDGLLVVVKLVGRCDMDGPAAILMTGPLGWSHEANGVVLPFSDLACDNIRGQVQSAPVAGNPLRGNVLLGRAMGRVLAHELYHIVADTAEHAGGGVAQPALSARELTSGQLEFQSSDVEAMRLGLRQPR